MLIVKIIRSVSFWSDFVLFKTKIFLSPLVTMTRYLPLLIVCACICQVFMQLNSPGAISRYAPGGQYIMLTFSGGPHHYATPRILDILKEQKAKATFFVTGSNAEAHPNLISRIHAEGHEVGNHGYHSHRTFMRLSPDDVVVSVNQTNKVINKIATSAVVKHVRPPEGLTNADVNQVIKSSCGAKVILWSLDSRDRQEGSAAEIAKTVLKKAVPGDVILMHDTTNQTITALPDILKGLHAQGYELLTIAAVTSFPDDSPH